MVRAISVRLDDKAQRALRALEAAGLRPKRLSIGARSVALPAAVVPVAIALGTLLGIVLTQLVFSGEPVFRIAIRAEEAALAALLLLLAPAYLVLKARDSRRLAAGIVFAAFLWFLLWYPNLSGLPLPDDVAQVYLGFLPTWNYAFQFAVNLDEPYRGSVVNGSAVVLLAVVVLLVVAVMYAARAWRSEVAARRFLSGGGEPEAA